MIDYSQRNKKGNYTDHWATPVEIYDRFMSEGYYDPCVLYSESTDLENDLVDKKMFVNPPYSKIMDWVDWVIKNHKEYGKEIVLLVPSRTDTKWFHKLLDYGAEVEFIKGRLKFGGAKGSAPFPSIYIYLKERKKEKK